MKKLEDNIRKNRFDYTLVKRSTSNAIYAQNSEGNVIAYEVFKIKIVKDGEVFGKFVEGHEKFPSDKDFGISAWSCRTLEKANQRFEELEKQSLCKN